MLKKNFFKDYFKFGAFYINYHLVQKVVKTDGIIGRGNLTFAFKFLSIFFPFFCFVAALGLRCCTRSFSSRGERGLLFVAVHKLLVVVASLVDHGL